MVFLTQTAHGINPKGSEKIRRITIRLFVRDCTGAVYFTDLLLQGGSIATGWVGHVSEIKWTLDG
ncbi:hypothetical protein PML95_04535 [Vagococcus lutrae]|uniref:Uncharacterized protein n=2 Tax=Lactobacillales TaxID=186826 RepID=A0AAF0BI12_9ENTE|nr:MULTISPECIES: hypothetical protein [Lactobacillales]WCG23497.1 hypothetical protein PML95_04535 [Vagococcus lutrae]SJZ69317.1 hypothetical protein SAMN02746011_01519 [Globicatella sulfidifaciens DSM 15739]